MLVPKVSPICLVNDYTANTNASTGADEGERRSVAAAVAAATRCAARDAAQGVAPSTRTRSAAQQLAVPLPPCAAWAHATRAYLRHALLRPAQHVLLALAPRRAPRLQHAAQHGLRRARARAPWCGARGGALWWVLTRPRLQHEARAAWVRPRSAHSCALSAAASALAEQSVRSKALFFQGARSCGQTTALRLLAAAAASLVCCAACGDGRSVNSSGTHATTSGHMMISGTHDTGDVSCAVGHIARHVTSVVCTC